MSWKVSSSQVPIDHTIKNLTREFFYDPCYDSRNKFNSLAYIYIYNIYSDQDDDLGVYYFIRTKEKVWFREVFSSRPRVSGA